jgi:hypothetical protein
MGGDCRRPIAAQFHGDLFGLKNCQRTWEKYRLALYFGQKRAFSDKIGKEACANYSM